jgi:perosamine synthetase
VRRIPLHEPVFAGNEWRYVKRCLDTGWVSSAGAFVDRFEVLAAERAGTRHAVACSTGTAALHLALLAAGVKAGDEALVPSLTFIATANAAAYLGAVPRFVDVEETTFGMDPDALERWLKAETVLKGGRTFARKTGRRVSVCVPMHAFGHPARIDRLVSLGRKRGIAVIEDAAEALGTLYKGRPAGSFGLAGTLSFNGNKTITCGGGGMVVTNDARLAKAARHLSTQAKKDSAVYLHDAVGYNYRLPNLNAAVGCAQYEQLSGFLKRKRQAAGWYREALDGAPGLRLLWEPAGARSNFWLNTVIFDDAARSRRALKALNAAGVEARPIWTPCHRQPMFEPLAAGRLDVTDRLWRTAFNIPSSSTLTRRDALAIAARLRKA